MENESNSGKIRWHRLLGGLFEELLIPVGVKVFTEFSVMSQSPVADILLLRKESGEWTSEQLKRLPDGIRDTGARHILIEFKYTESVGEDTFRQMVGYEFFYRKSRSLVERDVQPFVISAKTPRQSVLGTFGYSQTGKSGVFHSNNPFLKRMPLLSLNDLSDELHNAFVKCFASRKRDKRSAFETMARYGLEHFQQQIQWFIEGLWRYWFAEEGDAMKNEELTPKKIKEMGKMWEDFILSSLPPEERLKGLKPEERLKGLKPEERLKGLKAEEVLSTFSPEVIEAYLRKIKKKQ